MQVREFIDGCDVSQPLVVRQVEVRRRRDGAEYLKLALGDKAGRTPMSSLKSQIGHPQGACGAAGIAATLVAMHHRQIPPTINLEVADPECDLDYVPDLGRSAEIEHAVCNCIAFGSKNSALVLRRLA